MLISDKFQKYDTYNPLVSVWNVTHDIGSCIHRFFDTSPFSPSGRYLAILKMPYEDRLPKAGDEAQIYVIDLQTAEKMMVATTRGWETQLGANINWGTDDTQLYYNDVDINVWQPYCVKLNPFTGEKKRLDGTIYRISPNGKHIISACMKRMRRTQYGYGVIVPDEYVPRNYGFADDDGLYITDTESGKCKLLVSIRDIFEKAKPKIDEEKYRDGECYGFHCKYNPQGDRILFTLRWFKTEESQPWDMLFKHVDFWVVTMKTDGTDICVAVGPEQWEKGGHHINWFPDGENLSMNLCFDGDGKMYLTQCRYDGSNMKKIIDDIPGSGHPTVHPNGRYILTDAYAFEKVSYGDGTVPIRLVDLETKTEKAIIRVNVDNAGNKLSVALRLDPHPAWSCDYSHIAFNGIVNGGRHVFVAEMKSIIRGNV